jgi:nicotinate-nucleotide pyrophosphorylase (carboxylating)
MSPPKLRSEIVRRTHSQVRFLKITNLVYAQEVFNHTLQALKQDLGKRGDITTRLLKLEKHKCKAELLSKSKGILAGIQEINFFLTGNFDRKKLFKKIKLRLLKKDGDAVRPGEKIAEIEGSAGDILKIERTVLNLLQRMSGIATLMHMYTQKAGPDVFICPTRKTPWGLLDKRACVVGGGGTHRLSLADAILIKDTHLDLLQHDLEELFKRISSITKKEKAQFLEIEVEKPHEALTIAKKFRDLKKKEISLPCLLMFDNMKPDLIKKTITRLKKEKLYPFVLLEASGGINLQNIKKYAESGVDLLSIGALTHSAPALDFSLKIT